MKVGESILPWSGDATGALELFEQTMCDYVKQFESCRYIGEVLTAPSADYHEFIVKHDRGTIKRRVYLVKYSNEMMNLVWTAS
jgi:hypothetical protein